MCRRVEQARRHSGGDGAWLNSMAVGQSRSTAGRVCLLLLLLGLLTGCGLPQTGAGQSEISWVDVVRFDGITYMTNRYVEPGIAGASDLGEVHATVQFQIAGRVRDPEYRTKDGDATYLSAGTLLYSVTGYTPATRLAARLPDGVVLYDAFTNPAARTGADLLDIEGKVATIGINSEEDGTTELARIDTTATVSEMVTMVLEGTVDQTGIEQHGDDERYFIAFHLTDGTTIVRAFWPESGLLSHGIHLPPEFGAIVTQALESAHLAGG